ncbi:MAG: hypothetical protein PF572_02615 [Patescibacteria group bacterium]|jgi:amino acid transporter|nr:hypothetical protein [Patescibacteria group bacterium]
MNSLLSLKFWFSINPGALSPLGLKLFLVLVFFFVVLSVVLKILIMNTKEKLHRRLFRKILSLSVTNIFLLLVMFFLMYEKAPFLSSRFWFLVWGTGIVVWLVYIYGFYSKIPSQKEEREKNLQYNKYLP